MRRIYGASKGCGGRLSRLSVEAMAGGRSLLCAWKIPTTPQSLQSVERLSSFEPKLLVQSCFVVVKLLK